MMVNSLSVEIALVEAPEKNHLSIIPRTYQELRIDQLILTSLFHNYDFVKSSYNGLQFAAVQDCGGRRGVVMFSPVAIVSPIAIHSSTTTTPSCTTPPRPKTSSAMRTHTSHQPPDNHPAPLPI
jgi:hypothetical protein